MEHFVERLQIRPVEAGRPMTLFIQNVWVLRTHSNSNFWVIWVFSQIWFLIHHCFRNSVVGVGKWMSVSSRCFRKRTTAQLLFPHLLFCSWESFGFAGEWPNLLYLKLFYVLCISEYIFWIHFHIWNYSVISLRQKVFLKMYHDMRITIWRKSHLNILTVQGDVQSARWLATVRMAFSSRF